MKITAAVTETRGAPFVLEELEAGELRDDEVLVSVAASGICHTDVIARDGQYPLPMPVVLGHEGAGVVAAVGSSVRAVEVGARVCLNYSSCGECPSCLDGKPPYCHRLYEQNVSGGRSDGTTALSRHGHPVHSHFIGQSSFATAAVCRERSVVPIDSPIPLEILAPFGCGIQTGAGAVLNSLRAPAGSAIAIFGTGAVGLSAVIAAAIAGCEPIVGVDIVPDRLELALELGATHVVDSSRADPVAEIRRVTRNGADFSIDATGVPAVLESCLACLAPLGVLGAVGISPAGLEVPVNMGAVRSGGRTIMGIVEGDSVPRIFIPQLVLFWEQGRFPVERFMRFYEFDRIQEAAGDAEEGRTIKPVLRMPA
jgi:aryl-alcohol dehydrogenase